MAVKPFYPWVGGKRRLLDAVSASAPSEFGSYFEPFLGGGAVALHLMQDERFVAHTFHLSDLNAELIHAWVAVRDDIETLLGLLQEHSDRSCRSYFEAVRSWDTTSRLSHLTPTERGARFLYLVHSSFGAMWKESVEGRNSAHYGKDMTFDPKKFTRVHDLLQERDVRLYARSFADALPQLAAGDFVYLDPPYATDFDDDRDAFSDYQAGNTADDFQPRVKRFIGSLTSRGVMALASNADTATTRTLYAGWSKAEKSIRYTMSAAASTRTSTEVLWGNHHLARHLHQRGVTESTLTTN